jgi:DNA-directed RNA polymerase specialized sigma24 family protein
VAGLELFRALDLDWRILAASRSAQQGVRAWRSDRALRGLRGLDDVLARTARGAGRGSADAVLAALMRRAGDDELAARAVLQALVPGLVGVATRLGGRDDPDVASEVVAEAWARIRSYPIERRPQAVAANVILDVLMGTRRRRQRSDPVAVSALPLDDFDQRPSDSSARDRLDAVVEAGALREGDVAVVTDALGRRVPLGEAARRAGCSPRAMKDRRWRARRRVAAAMHASA